jgi:nicotinamidase-related amidase
MYKSRWGAFYTILLEEHLRSLDINTVIIAGCNFPNCPRSPIHEASERDFESFSQKTLHHKHRTILTTLSSASTTAFNSDPGRRDAIAGYTS